MKKAFLLIMIWVLLALVSGGRGLRANAQQPPTNPIGNPCDPLRLGQGCTVFYASDGGLALGGNNEDYWNPFTKMWFLPAQDGQHGRVYFGFDDFIPQGGMNDAGVFFDGLGVENVTVPLQGKPVYGGILMDKAMADCATVQCVLNVFDTYDRGGTWNGQLLVGDATGDAAIIEPLAIIRKTDWYLLATNFYQSQTRPEDITCWRYKTAQAMLDEAGKPSVDLFRDVLGAVHQEGQAQTLYSNVYDLKQRLVYLYFFHDFEHEIVLNLDEELAKGPHTVDLPSLFPDNEAYATWAHYRIERFNARQEAGLAQNIDPGVYASYVGEYAIPAELGVPYTTIVVSSDDGHLYGDIVGDHAPERELFPQSETTFFHLDSERNSEFTVTFMTGDDGKVTQMLFQPGSGPEIPLMKVDAQTAS
jgi:hypothetical protein